MTETRDEETTLFLRGVPENIKREFKASCYEQGYTMQDVIIALMRVYLRDPRIVIPPELK